MQGQLYIGVMVYNLLKNYYITGCSCYSMQKQSNNCWLSDRIIIAAQGLLKTNAIPCLKNTLLGSTLTFDIVGRDEFVQA